MLVCQHRNARSVRERRVQRPLLILAPLFFMINSPVTGVVITQVPVPVTTAAARGLCLPLQCFSLVFGVFVNLVPVVPINNRNDRRRGYDGHQAASGGGWRWGKHGLPPRARPLEMIISSRGGQVFCCHFREQAGFPVSTKYHRQPVKEEVYVHDTM